MRVITPPLEPSSTDKGTGALLSRAVNQPERCACARHPFVMRVICLRSRNASTTCCGNECISGSTPEGGSNLTTGTRSEEHTSELQSLMRISYAVFCLKKKIQKSITQ